MDQNSQNIVQYLKNRLAYLNFNASFEFLSNLL